MKQRGRKSAEATAVVVQGNFGKRADPPAELTEDQADIWRETVAGEAAEVFATAAVRNILADYCRHRSSAKMVSGVIDTFEPQWIKSAEGAKRFQGLLKMRETETRAAATLATKMRLTNQARYTPGAAATLSKNTAKGYNPWEE